MRKRVALLVAVLLLLPLLGAVAVYRAPTQFDRLLALAVAADREYDKAADWRPETANDYRGLIDAILWQFSEAGIVGVPRYPAGIVLENYGLWRSAVAGMYHPGSDVVSLNERFFHDPGWKNHTWFETLVHELIHAQGFDNEAQTETLALEITAELANLDYPGFRREIMDEIRRGALATAFYIAEYRGEMRSTSQGAGGIAPCQLSNAGEMQCPKPTPDAGLLGKWQAARHLIFTPEELRRSDARIRYWTGAGMDYAGVLDAYVARPMGLLLGAACTSGYELPEQFFRVNRDNPDAAGRLVGPFRVDDFAYDVAELGWAC